MGVLLTLVAQIALILFKLLGIITWSWWWVLSPLIASCIFGSGAAICFSGAALAIMGGLLIVLFTRSDSKKQNKWS